MTDLKTKWLIYGGVGLALVGAGFSVAVDAAFVRFNDPESWQWIIQGTVGLCLLNAGLSIFGEAVVLKIKLSKHESER